MTQDTLSLVGDVLSAQSHRHSFIHLILSLNQQPLTVKIDNNDYNSTAFLINGDVTHQVIQVNQPYWLILINHTSSLASCLRYLWLDGNIPFLDISQQVNSLLPQAYRQFQQPISEEEYRDLWNKLVQQLEVSNCYQSHKISDKRVNAVLATLRETTLQPLQDEKILADIYLSRSRFSHLFTDITGGNLKNYILFHRLIATLLQISQGSSATQAALDNGFDSPSHLSSTCRKLMGISPRFAKQVSQFLKVLPK